MGLCEVCGNEYDKSFTVKLGQKIHEFDSFECAIHQLAPECVHCSMKIIGHGVECSGRVYCCANCARAEGMEGIRDRHDKISEVYPFSK